MKKTINTMEELLKTLGLENENQIDWIDVSRNRKLSENFIEKHANQVDWFYISAYQKLSEDFIEKYKDKVDWRSISIYQKLSENFIEKYKDKVFWYRISKYQNLSEPFIEKHADKVDWDWISMYQELSEDFIEQHKNEVDWISISMHQKLSEDFIEKHKDKVDWDWISIYQELSEDFIDTYADKVDWHCISMYQKLSENFIEQHKNDVDWDYISEYQNLSENFIEEHKYNVNWYCISKYQKLSKQFIEKYKNNLNIRVIKDSWHYKSTEFKKQAVINTGLYDCYDDYFIAYKGIRGDRYSNFNFQYQYLPNQTYETFADYSENENSFGFSAGDYENAKDYCDELVVKVKIYYKDVARVVHNGNKIRACKITILDSGDYMMKKYFIIPSNTPAYQNLFEKKESENKFAKAFGKFANENNIKTNSFYAREDRLAIIPYKEDKDAYSNEFLRNQEGVFKKNSVLSKKWVEYCKKLGLTSVPEITFFYLENIWGKCSCEYFFKDNILYYSICSESNFKAPEDWKEIKASDFYYAKERN